MSLIADALKRIKKEKQEKKDEIFTAPPALRNAQGRKSRPGRLSGGANGGAHPNVKGFVAICGLALVVALGAAFYYNYKERDGMSREAVIAENPAVAVKTSEGATAAAPAVSGSGSSAGSPPAEASSRIAETGNSPSALEPVTVDRSNNDEYGKEKTKSPILNARQPELANSAGMKAPAAPNRFFPPTEEKKEPVKMAAAPQKTVSSPAPAKKTTTSSEAFIPLKPQEAPLVKRKNPVPATTRELSSDEKVTYNSLIAQGQSAKEEENYEEAIKYFKNASNIRQSDEVTANIASLYLEAGNPGNALKTAISGSLKDPVLASRLSIDMVNSGYMPEAAKMLQYAKTLPLVGETAYAEGYFYEKEKRYDKATEFYKKAFDMNMKEAVYLYSYARALDLDEKYEEAIKNYGKVLEMKPGRQVRDFAEARAQALTQYLESQKVSDK